jgi:uncharacterized protein (TIGR00299 family) protein
MRHLHLDPLGGVAGDMFAAALLDAFPEHLASVEAAVRLAAGVPCRLLRHRDDVLSGSRFAVDAEPRGHHTHWTDIRARLLACGLDGAVARHAVGIFSVLADAEAEVHGVDPDAVAFHEVGALDSIADIVAAAVLIAAIGEASWSVGVLPLGAGRVQTAHGPMPVPAPATALLLRGFDVTDDSIGGERVTPTGAALLRYLGANGPPGAATRRLARSGIGFGTRRLPGLSNCLRVLVFAPAEDGAGAYRSMAVIGFEVDDQTPEDLAAGLDRLRAVPGVHDVLQMPAFGKKGRMAAHIQVLARPEAEDAVAAACFRETTTIGLRIARVEGRALARSVAPVTVDDAAIRVKLVERPDGVTAKAESADVQDAPSQAARAALRREAERLATEDAT